MITQKSNLREVLASLLENKKISEAELSRKTGVSQPTIHRLLSGATPDTRISTIKAIANFFEVTIGQLTGDEPLSMMSQSNLNSKIVKVPIIPWENAFEWKKIIAKYIPTNWDYWTTIDNQASKNSYAMINKNPHLPLPFAYDCVVVVDPEAKYKIGSYLVVYKVSNKSVSIKKLHLEGVEKWLMPLNKKINAETLDDDFLICGTIIQSNIPLFKDEGE